MTARAKSSLRGSRDSRVVFRLRSGHFCTAVYAVPASRASHDVNGDISRQSVLWPGIERSAGKEIVPGSTVHDERNAE
jgi:hypothetical protein